MENANNAFNKFEEICRLFPNSKITEKKNLIARISDLIGDECVIKSLDFITHSKRSKLSTNEQAKIFNNQYSQNVSSRYAGNNTDWNDLFEIISNYLVTELNSSVNTDTKFFKIKSILNLYLNQVNSRSEAKQNLDFSKFYILFQTINDKFQNQYGFKLLNDLSLFFYNYIIDSAEYCCLIEKAAWLNLISIFITNYKNSQLGQPSIDQNVSVKCLGKILSVCFKYTGFFNGTKLFGFFNFAILNIKSNSHYDLIEHLLIGLVSCCNYFSYECLFQVCKLSQDVSFKLLTIYNDKQNTFLIKEMIVNFLNLAVVLNRILKESQSISPNLKWIQMQYSIYNRFLEELYLIYNQKISQSNSKTKNKTSIIASSFKQSTKVLAIWQLEDKILNLISNCLIELLDINIDQYSNSKFTKMINDEDDDESKENVSESQQEQSQYGRYAKKRRIQSLSVQISWQYLINKFKNLNSSCQKYAWLSLFNYFINNNCDKVKNEFLELLVDYLLKQLEITSLSPLIASTNPSSTNTNSKNINEVFADNLKQIEYRLLSAITIHMSKNYFKHTCLFKSEIFEKLLNYLSSQILLSLNCNNLNELTLNFDLLCGLLTIDNVQIKIINKKEAILYIFDKLTQFIDAYSNKSRTILNLDSEYLNVLLNLIQTGVNSCLSLKNDEDKKFLTRLMDSILVKYDSILNSLLLMNKLDDFVGILNKYFSKQADLNKNLIAKILLNLLFINNDESAKLNEKPFKELIDVEIFYTNLTSHLETKQTEAQSFLKCNYYQIEIILSKLLENLMQQVTLNESNHLIIMKNLTTNVTQEENECELSQIEEDAVFTNKVIVNALYLDQLFINIEIIDSLIRQNLDKTTIYILQNQIFKVFNYIFDCIEALIKMLKPMLLVKFDSSDDLHSNSRRQHETKTSYLCFILNYILRKFYSNFSCKQVSYVFYLDAKKLIGLLEDILDDFPNSKMSDLNKYVELINQSNKSKDIINIMLENKNIDQSQQLKLLSLSLLCLISNQYLFSNEASISKNKQMKNIAIKNLKLSIDDFIKAGHDLRAKLFERFNNEADINKADALNLLAFLSNIKQKMPNCQYLALNELRFCLNIFNKLIFNKKYIHLYLKDPIIAFLSLSLFNDYSKILLRKSAFVITQIELKLRDKLIKKGEFEDDQHDITDCQQAFLKIFENRIYSKSSLLINTTANVEETCMIFSEDCILEVLDLLAQCLKTVRLSIIETNLKIELSAKIEDANDEDKKIIENQLRKVKKDLVKKQYEYFEILISSLFGNVRTNSNITKLKCVNLLINSAFSRDLFTKNLNEYYNSTYQESENLNLNYIFSLLNGENTKYLATLDFLLINDEYECGFFDRYYRNFIEICLSNNMSEHENGLSELNVFFEENTQEASPRSDTFEKRLKSLKPFESFFYAKHNNLLIFKSLLSYLNMTTTSNRRKCEVKSLLALTQLNTEFSGCFELKQIRKLLDDIALNRNYSNSQDYLEHFSLPLINEWICAYVDFEHDMNNESNFYETALEKKIHKLFGYESFQEFLNDKSAEFVTLYFLNYNLKNQSLNFNRNGMNVLNKSFIIKLSSNSANMNQFIDLETTNEQFIADFYGSLKTSVLFTNFFFTKENKKEKLLIFQKLVDANLIKVSILERYFADLFAKLILKSSSGNETSSLFDDGIDIILTFISKRNDHEKMKIFTNLILNSIKSSSSLTVYIFDILFQLNNKIIVSYNKSMMAECIHFIELCEIFYNKYALNLISLINTNSKNKVNNSIFFIYSYLSFSLVNLIEICVGNIKKIDEKLQNRLEETFCSIFNYFIYFNNKILSSVFNIFEMMLKNIENENLNDYDIHLSCIISSLLNYLNLSQNVYKKNQLKVLEDNFKYSSFNYKLMKNLIQILLNYSQYSIALTRFLKFITVIKKSYTKLNKQENSIMNNETLKNVFYSTLKLHLYDLVSSMEFNVNVNFESRKFLKDECDCLFVSDEFKNDKILDFLFCYLTNLVFIQTKYECKQITMKFLNVLLDKFCESGDKLRLNELKNYVMINLYNYGPINVSSINLNSSQIQVTAHKSLMLDKLSQHLDSSKRIIIYPVYYLILEEIFELLTSENSELQIISKNTLELIFNSPESVSFMIAYEAIAHELSSQNMSKSTKDIFSEFIKPFLASKNKKLPNTNSNKTSLTINNSNEKLTFKNPYDFFNIENSTLASSYDEWLKDLILRLVKTSSLNDEICFMAISLLEKMRCIVLEQILPYLIINLLKQDEHITLIGDYFNKFFNYEIFHSANINLDEFKKATKLIIHVVEFLRKSSIANTKKCTFYLNEIKFWSQFDFLIVARVCQACNLHFNSIYYLEIWYDQQKSKLKKCHQKNNKPSDDVSSLMLTNKFLNTKILKSNPVSIELLMNAYKEIGQSDVLHSNLIYLVDESCQMNFYENQRPSESIHSFDNFLHYHNNLANRINVLKSKSGLVESLKKSGFEYLLTTLLNEPSQTIANVKDTLLFDECQLFKIESNSFMKKLKESEEQYYDIKLHDMKYNRAWKMGSWDDLNLEEGQIKSFNKYIYESLSSFSQIDPASRKTENSSYYFNKILLTTNNCRSFLLDELKSRASFSNFNLHIVEASTRLYFLEEIENSVLFFKNNEIENLVINLISYDAKKHVKDLSNIKSFELLDDLYTIRLEFLKKCASLCSDDRIKSSINSRICDLYENAIDNSIIFDRFQQGQIYITEMRNYSQIELRCDLKESILLKAKSDLKKALFLMKNSLEKFEQSGATKLLTDEKHQLSKRLEYYLKSLDFYSIILNESKSESPSLIIKDYLEKSVEIIHEFKELKNPKNSNLIASSYYSLGKFADIQYTNLLNYMSSASYKERTQLMKQFEIEKSKAEKYEPTSEFSSLLRKQHRIDKEEATVLLADKNNYLYKSIESYLSFLELDFSDNCGNGQQEDYCVFRFVSLWTQNTTDFNVNRLIKEKLHRIPTYKFHKLMYQLTARISYKNSIQSNIDERSSSSHSEDEAFFQKILIELIVNLAKDHPYHMLPILLAFSNLHKDDFLNCNNSKTVADKTNDKKLKKHLMAEDRVNTANHVLEKVKGKNDQVRLIVESLETVCNAYIELANLNVSKQSQTKTIEFPKNLQINKIKNFNLVNVLTNSLPINPSGDYDEKYIASIVKFDNKFTIANGLNAPKILICHASDGTMRKQLVKSNDDLRQDVVIEQFFETFNHLIVKSNFSQQNLNKLNTIRTYKIVPLSNKSGVLEWCQNTITLGDWLVGENQDAGAHRKYEPGDYKSYDCKVKMRNAEKKPLKDRLNIFNDICKNYHPVMRYFFMENYTDSIEWFQKRLNYTKSIATASILGYIVGLGDRHVNNILIDTTTADVIHIDLGIAFEQGKILSIPETIPFRLTRDIIDGFGACGIEGTFRNDCETILELLKNSRELIITIFEVLLYDPLYKWSLSPKKAMMLHNTDELNTVLLINDSSSPIVLSDNSKSNLNSSAFDRTPKTPTQATSHNKATTDQTNKIAKRIVFQLNQKLLGYENDAQLSTSGHINYLINEAVNPENLCTVFCGWQPFL